MYKPRKGNNFQNGQTGRRLKGICHGAGTTEEGGQPPTILFDLISSSPGTKTLALPQGLKSSKFLLRYGNIKNLLVRT